MWQQLVSESFVTLDVEPLVSGAGFSGDIQALRFDDLQVSRVSVRSDPHLVRRTRRQAESEGGPYLVSVQLTGTCLVRQGGREAVLEPSDLALYDSAAPYDLIFPQGDHSQVVLEVPRSTMTDWLPEPRASTALTVAGAAGAGAAVSPLLGSLLAALPSMDPFQARRLLDHALDLLGLALTGRAVPADAHEDVRRAHLSRARAFIQHHAHDDLRPAALAAGVHVSVGYLHRLFQAEGTTIAREILAVRLARCRDELTDDRYSKQTVAEIAHRAGFKDAAHFTRAFSQRYGATPARWRHPAGPGRANHAR
jgi:AraC-like DNA-binding protein